MRGLRCPPGPWVEGLIVLWLRGFWPLYPGRGATGLASLAAPPGGGVGGVLGQLYNLYCWGFIVG